MLLLGDLRKYKDRTLTMRLGIEYIPTEKKNKETNKQTDKQTLKK